MVVGGRLVSINCNHISVKKSAVGQRNTRGVSISNRLGKNYTSEQRDKRVCKKIQSFLESRATNNLCKSFGPTTTPPPLFCAPLQEHQQQHRRRCCAALHDTASALIRQGTTDMHVLEREGRTTPGWLGSWVMLHTADVRPARRAETVTVGSNDVVWPGGMRNYGCNLLKTEVN